MSGFIPTDHSEELRWEDTVYDPDQLDPADEAVERETHDIVRQKLEHLSPTHRQVVKEFYFEYRSVAEIAQRLMKPEGTVKRLLFEARSSCAKCSLPTCPSDQVPRPKRHFGVAGEWRGDSSSVSLLRHRPPFPFLLRACGPLLYSLRVG